MYGESTHQILNHMHFLKRLTDSLEQWFLTFLMLRPLNTVPHVVEISSHRIILLILYNSIFATVMNHVANTWYSWYLTWDPCWNGPSVPKGLQPTGWELFAWRNDPIGQCDSLLLQQRKLHSGGAWQSLRPYKGNGQPVWNLVSAFVCDVPPGSGASASLLIFPG